MWPVPRAPAVKSSGPGWWGSLASDQGATSYCALPYSETYKNGVEMFPVATL